MTLLGRHAENLKELSAAHRLRRLAPRAGHDFSSNDYLGLANDPRLADAARAALDRGVGIGSGGSRLLRGNDPEHEALEVDLRAKLGSELFELLHVVANRLEAHAQRAVALAYLSERLKHPAESGEANE